MKQEYIIDKDLKDMFISWFEDIESLPVAMFLIKGRPSETKQQDVPNLLKNIVKQYNQTCK